MSLTVEALAKEIRRADENYGAGDQLATALLPFIERHIAAGQQGAGDDGMLSIVAANDAAWRLAKLAVDCGAEDNATDDQPQTWTLDVAAFTALARRLATPQPPKPGGIGSGLTPEHPGAIRLDYCAPGFAKPAGAVPIPDTLASWSGSPPIVTLEDAIRYGDAREAAGRADAVPAERIEALAAAMESREGVAIHLRTAATEVRGLLEAIPQQPAAEGKPVVHVGTIGHISRDKGTLTAALTKIGQMTQAEGAGREAVACNCHLSPNAWRDCPHEPHRRQLDPSSVADAEALLANEIIALAAEREQGYANREHGGVLNGRIADKVVALARRLPGGQTDA